MAGAEDGALTQQLALLQTVLIPLLRKGGSAKLPASPRVDPLSPHLPASLEHLMLM